MEPGDDRVVLPFGSRPEATPPRFAIHDIGPEAITPPPGDVSGPYRISAVPPFRNVRSDGSFDGRSVEEMTMRKVIGLVMVVGALALGACNTVSGAGRDVSSAGRAVSKTADDAK